MAVCYLVYIDIVLLEVNYKIVFAFMCYQFYTLFLGGNLWTLACNYWTGCAHCSGNLLENSKTILLIDTICNSNDA